MIVLLVIDMMASHYKRAMIDQKKLELSERDSGNQCRIEVLNINPDFS